MVISRSGDAGAVGMLKLTVWNVVVNGMATGSHLRRTTSTYGMIDQRNKLSQSLNA
jgi:hypothetical protein